LKQLAIEGPFITLAQLLKTVDIIASGGQAKAFLQATKVKVNGEWETRRGRKIYLDDTVNITGYFTVKVV
jgi:ribosome-associated protein